MNKRGPIILICVAVIFIISIIFTFNMPKEKPSSEQNSSINNNYYIENTSLNSSQGNSSSEYQPYCKNNKTLVRFIEITACTQDQCGFMTPSEINCTIGCLNNSCVNNSY